MKDRLLCANELLLWFLSLNCFWMLCLRNWMNNLWIFSFFLLPPPGDRYSRVVFTSAAGETLWNLPAIKSMCNVDNSRVCNVSCITCSPSQVMLLKLLLCPGAGSGSTGWLPLCRTEPQQAQPSPPTIQVSLFPHLWNTPASLIKDSFSFPLLFFVHDSLLCHLTAGFLSG